VETKSGNQFTPASAGDTDNNSSETITTDNNLSNAQKRPISNKMLEFCQAFCEGMGAVAGQISSQDADTEKSPVVEKEMIFEPKVGYPGCVTFLAENGPVLTIDYKNQAAGNSVLPPVFAMPLISNCSVEEGKNSNGAQILDKNQILTDSGKTAADDEMSAPAPVFQQEDAGADKSVVSGNQKTLINTSLLASQESIPSTALETGDEFCLDKSILLDQKATDNKAAPTQQAVLTSPELSESLLDKGKDCIANNVLDDSLLKKLNSEQIISISKALVGAESAVARKGSGNSSTTSGNFRDNSSMPFNQIFSVNSAQYSVAEQSSSAASASKLANAASQSDVSASVSKQIQESIHSSLRQDEQQITIRLNPPELGRVSIQFREQDGQLVGLLEVSKAQTRAEIQQALPQIIQNLADSGVQVKRLEVLLTNQQEQQDFKDPSLAAGADGSSGQGQPGTNSDSQENNSAWVRADLSAEALAKADEWLTNDLGYTSFIEPSVHITNDSINILV
jgi:flagellar hook-length control protein FliK